MALRITSESQVGRPAYSAEDQQSTSAFFPSRLGPRGPLELSRGAVRLLGDWQG